MGTRSTIATPAMHSTNNMAFLWGIVLFGLLPITYADNETVIPIDSIVPSLTYVAVDAVQMDSVGFVDLSLLQFTRLDDADEATVVDIAVFAMADDFAGNLTVDSMDYQSVGITMDGYTCCNAEAQKAGVCIAAQAGRLIVDEDTFDGAWLSATIRASITNASINPYEFDPILNIERRGYYALLFANCDEQATDIQISGDTYWVSFYTDQEIENSVPIYIGLVLAYLCLLLWFGYLMYDNQSSQVPLEVCILVAIVLGLAATSLKTLYYANESKHITWLAIITELFGAAKNGVSRCLLLMLSLGWGVTVATLEQRLMIPIIILSANYMILSLADDIISIVASAKVEEADEGDQDEGTVGTIRWILSYIDAIIWYWIITAMCNTMKYLQENHQERKLQRYRWLLGIMITALILNILAFVFITMEIASDLTVNITIWPEVNEAGFFLTLICVAILWRPNPHAREYAYVVELSPNDEVFDLELTEVSSTALPVAEIGDDDIDSHHEGNITNRSFT